MISLFLLVCLSIYQSIYAHYMWLCWPSDWRMSRLHSNMALIEKLAISHISSSSFLFAWDPRSPFWSWRQSVSKLLQDVANPCREMLSSILSWTDFCWNCKSEGNIQRCKLVKSNGNAPDLLGGISQSTRPWSPSSRITGSCGTATCMGRCGCLRILYDHLSTIAGHNLRIQSSCLSMTKGLSNKLLQAHVWIKLPWAFSAGDWILRDLCHCWWNPNFLSGNKVYHPHGWVYWLVDEGGDDLWRWVGPVSARSRQLKSIEHVPFLTYSPTVMTHPMTVSCSLGAEFLYCSSFANVLGVASSAGNCRGHDASNAQTRNPGTDRTAGGLPKCRGT